MSEPPPIEECDAMLAEVARMDLLLARHVHGEALDTVEPKALSDLTRSYARATRSMRQNLALLYKLKADRAKAEREAREHARAMLKPLDADEGCKTPLEVAREARADHLVDALERVIGHVAAGDRERHTALAHRFERELDDWYEKPDFLVLDPKAHVRLACRRLGLPEELAERWECLPEPTFFPDPEPRRRDPHDLKFDAAPPPPEPDSANEPPVPRTDTG